MIDIRLKQMCKVRAMRNILFFPSKFIFDTWKSTIMQRTIYEAILIAYVQDDGLVHVIKCIGPDVPYEAIPMSEFATLHMDAWITETDKLLKLEEKKDGQPTY